MGGRYMKAHDRAALPRRQADIAARDHQTPSQIRMADEFRRDVENRYENSMQAERAAIQPLRQTAAALTQRVRRGDKSYKD